MDAHKRKTLPPQLDRYVILAVLVIIITGVFIARLIELQIVQGERFREETITRITTTGTIHASRGNIYDRNGVPIAGNRMGFAVDYVDVRMPNAEKNEMLLELYDLLERHGVELQFQLDRIVDWERQLVMLQDEGAREAFIQAILVAPEDRGNLITSDQIINYMRDVLFEIGVQDDSGSSQLKSDTEYTEAEIRTLLRMRYEILRNEPRLNNPMLLASDVGELAMSEIEERSDEFPGVSTHVRPYRVYYDAQVVSHLLGYVGMATDREVRNLNSALVENFLGMDEGDLAYYWPKTNEQGALLPLTRGERESNSRTDEIIAQFGRENPGLLYTNRDVIGKSGIEIGAEELLRGIDGQTTKEVDRTGRITEVTLDRPAQPGADVYLTIDLALQKTAVESLQRNITRIRGLGGRENFGDASAGAVVVLDVRTGEVLALVSWPDFDPNDFIEGDNETIAALLSDPGRRTWNRATQGAYPPASTYKSLVAVAALETETITPETRILSNRTDTWLNNRLETDARTHLTNLQGNQGAIELTEALSTSSNMYFFKIGVMTGIDQIAHFARMFGFGRKTGIEIDESTGSLASREFKRQFRNEAWFPLNTAMAAIGQLYNAFTPLQLANYAAIIANGGTRYTPHLVRMAVSDLGAVVREPKEEGEQLDVSAENLAAVREGMVAVANAVDGTAVRIFRDFPFVVAGKTGTAETGREEEESSHGLFVGYAPADDPQIAIAVVIEHGVWGSFVAPVARDVFMSWFRLGEAKADGIERSIRGNTEILW